MSAFLCSVSVKTQQLGFCLEAVNQCHTKFAVGVFFVGWYFFNVLHFVGQLSGKTAIDLAL